MWGPLSGSEANKCLDSRFYRGTGTSSSSSSSIEILEATSAMASGTVSSSHPDWANLLGEILTLIAKRLSAVDYSSFSAVCTSWASTASPENGMPRPLPLRKNRPYLLFSGDGAGDCERSDFCTLLDFHQDSSFIKIHPFPEIRGKWVVGSQFGWLAVVDELANPSLLNPFTRSEIKLPPISTVPEIAAPAYDSEGRIKGYSYEDEFYPLEECRAFVGIQKLVLSSDPAAGDFGAVAIGPFGILMFARPREERWNLWNPHSRHPLVDVIYRDGKFLAVTNFGDVYAIDLASPFCSLKESLFAKSCGGYSDTRYLVDSSGLLLHVFREQASLEEEEEESRMATCKIEIRSLDPETRTWVPVTSLGDRSLFIGSCCSASLPAKEMPWLEENCVYFTDDNWGVLVLYKETRRDIGMFNLSNGSFRTCCPPELRLTWPPPVWITTT